MNVKYTLDPKQSRLTVQVFAGGLLAGLGHNPTIALRGFGGVLEFDSDDPHNNAFHITVQAKSLEVTDDIKKTDRLEIERQMRDDVLEAAKYPEIRFASADMATEKVGDGLYSLQITGDLALHGVTRRLRIGVQLKVREEEARLTGGFSLLLSDFKIKRVTALAGALKVKDEVKFSIDIAAVKGV